MLLAAAALEGSAQEVEPTAPPPPEEPAGVVEVAKPDFTLVADEVTYDSERDIYEATGNVRVTQAEWRRAHDGLDRVQRHDAHGGRDRRRARRRRAEHRARGVRRGRSRVDGLGRRARLARQPAARLRRERRSHRAHGGRHVSHRAGQLHDLSLSARVRAPAVGDRRGGRGPRDRRLRGRPRPLVQDVGRPGPLRAVAHLSREDRAAERIPDADLRAVEPQRHRALAPVLLGGRARA